MTAPKPFEQIDHSKAQDHSSSLNSTFVHEAGDHNFEEKVIHRSLQVPVLVDCWAEWCEPCKALGPTLERLTQQYKGRFELVKVDIDQAQRVAMALRVQSVPFMILFINGRPVDGLVGNQSESELRTFLDRHLPPDEGDGFEAGLEALKLGEYRQALQCFQQVLLEEPNRSDVRLAMARATLALGDLEASEQLLNSISADQAEYAKAQNLKRLFSLAEYQGNEDELKLQTQSQATAVDAWYRLGVTYAFQGQFKEACESFLKVVSLDRTYGEDAGRQALLLMFEVLGGDGEIVSTSRRALASLLF